MKQKLHVLLVIGTIFVLVGHFVSMLLFYQGDLEEARSASVVCMVLVVIMLALCLAYYIDRLVLYIANKLTQKRY